MPRNGPLLLFIGGLINILVCLVSQKLANCVLFVKLKSVFSKDYILSYTIHESELLNFDINT
jgi:hypothetical protein